MTVRQAAKDWTLLQHEHGLSGSRDGARCAESVMAAAYDNEVPRVSHHGDPELGGCNACVSVPSGPDSGLGG
jgi:hypothetical protein